MSHRIAIADKTAAPRAASAGAGSSMTDRSARPRKRRAFVVFAHPSAARRRVARVVCPMEFGRIPSAASKTGSRA
jgi:hypothetical protein